MTGVQTCALPICKDLLDINPLLLKDVKDTHTIKDGMVIKDKTKMFQRAVSSEGLSVRELSILGVLRTGGELGIRDIASNLPEYSEKMVQRDLMRLVITGRVKKTGLKRWSRYSIVA